ncbi:MAG: DUF134 domain-containing protein [Melioribacteraceae bacterium]|nr:DUF134 domain-containing protein [Melioribacteraceae bacterium]
MKKHRKCRFLSDEKVFKPLGIPMIDLVTFEIDPDEIEVMRICDLEGKSQIEAADRMKVSRGTIQRLLLSGRYKLIDALLNSRAIKLKNKY